MKYDLKSLPFYLKSNSRYHFCSKSDLIKIWYNANLSDENFSLKVTFLISVKRFRGLKKEYH